ncbi:hypothetical protein [Jiulongibacter sp. NS-SX5]|uniref:hypothetical protein n=1 Tax=Jiulongibacter sp. NS-SX5 TaxID=3463854 RepID=UPI004057ED6C
MKARILNWLGLNWVKWLLGIVMVLGSLFLLWKGFEAVVINPIVEKRVEPVKWSLDSARVDIANYTLSDSLQKRQIGELQTLIKKVEYGRRKTEDSLIYEFQTFNVKRTAEFQGVIRKMEVRKRELEKVLDSLRQAQWATRDSLRKAESGLRVDLVTLKFGWLGKLKDSTYVEGYRWPLDETIME